MEIFMKRREAFLVIIGVVIGLLPGKLIPDPDVKEVWSFNLLNSDLTIGEITDTCFNGSLIAFDNETGQLFTIDRYNGNLELLKIFKKGGGPDEYQSISSIFCEDSKIYLLDHAQNKLISYDSESEKILENPVNTYLNWMTKLIKIEDEFYVNNFDPENHFFYTRLSDGRKFIQPFKEGEVPRYALRAMEQLTQSALLYHDKFYYHFLHAPYRITKFNEDFREIETVVDEKSVEPWKDHIFVNDVRYRVGRYPRLGDDCFKVDDKALCEYYIYDEGISYIDVWSLPELKKIASLKNHLNNNEINFFLSQAIPGRSENEIDLLFVNYETLDVRMLSLTLNQ